MSYVYALSRSTEPQTIFYIGETTSPESRLTGHVGDYWTCEEKVHVLLNEAELNGGFIMRIMFDTPGKKVGRAVEAMVSYLKHTDIVNPNTSRLLNVLRHLNGASIDNIKITPFGISVLNSVNLENDINCDIMEFLLKGCTEKIEDFEISKEICTIGFNKLHRYCQSYYGVVK